MAAFASVVNGLCAENKNVEINDVHHNVYVHFHPFVSILHKKFQITNKIQEKETHIQKRK